jgi:hypothetical protein
MFSREELMKAPIGAIDVLYIPKKFTLDKYKLTPAIYSEMLQEQGFVCAICKEVKPLEIDHDHKTGKVRGLLCHNCNVCMGYFDAKLIPNCRKYKANNRSTRV